MNKVTMVVTNKQVGYSFLRSCAGPDTSLYLVPTYLMELKWTEGGKEYICEYEVVRFGIDYDAASGRTFVNDQLKNATEPIKIFTWFDYKTGNHNAEVGAWKIWEKGEKQDNLVHDGPDEPRWFLPKDEKYFAFCSLGCLLVCGEGQWRHLNETIGKAAGVGESWGRAAGKKGNLWIQFQQVSDEQFPKLYEIDNWRDEQGNVNLGAVAPKIGEFLKETFGTEPPEFQPRCEAHAPTPDRGLLRRASAAVSAEHTDPLILDLNGDGIKTVTLQDGVNFDHDANGLAEQTSWVDPDDGFLVLDRNGNGFIDDGRELFGNATILSNGKNASNGFEALAGLDSNKDGRIDAPDPIFSQLRVWKDEDQDGYSYPDELHTLDELGIKSINLQSTITQSTDEQGNIQNRVEQIQFMDGTVRTDSDIPRIQFGPQHGPNSIHLWAA
ncbi:MAG: hypothetical protein HY913_08220 [Desulfomonile tiedjei]|nr:hypothetical protein [Desulfomonile tiedjei]